MANEPSKPIAIVGSSCRLPGGVSSPSEFWELLCHPRDLLQEIPGDRFDANAFYNPNPDYHGTSNVKSAYFLQQDPARFDASFFNINPREAEAIDPQQRMLLELVYEAMESAGYPLESLRGTKTGVFAGLMSTDYHDIQARDVMSLSQYHATGTARSILSNRISYFYDFRGPSITIDTACSSSLVAVHLAVQALRNRECNVAVVAGVNLILGPEMFMSTSNLHMLSPDGKCQMWDAKANGYARAEGGGVLVLRTLEDALQNQVLGTIQSIIRETGVNSDGRTPGITMPSSASQVDLMRTTFERAGLDPTNPDEQCQYFEAHGTGTQAGDAAESKAIYTVFCEPSESIQTHHSPHDTNPAVPPILVGSVKPMFGHSEGAAGIVGLLKTSLSLHHAIIPPNPPIQHLSDKVSPYSNRLKIPHQLQEWPPTKTRRACVNSFGFGGTNAHVIVESYDDRYDGTSMAIEDEVILGPFVFSATSQSSLQKMMLSYRRYLLTCAHINLADLSWSLFQHRSSFPVRAAVYAQDVPGLVGALEREAHSAQTLNPVSSVSPSAPRKGLLGVFTGQGAQWPSMGRSLFFKSRRFASTMHELDTYLQELASPPSWSLVNELLKPACDSRVHIAEFSQPLCTALQIALLDVLFTTGVHFDAVVGHSSGEIAASYAAGCITARAAIQIGFLRGCAVSRRTDGQEAPTSMMAVGCSALETEQICREPAFYGKIFLAASNAPSSSTVSGTLEALERLETQLHERGKTARMLKVDQAYHSPFIAHCSEEYLCDLADCKIDYRSSSTSVWTSSVHGYPMDECADSVDNEYWSNNLINPVLFKEAIEHISGSHGPFLAALEIGPHPALRTPVVSTIERVTGSKVPYMGILERGMDANESLEKCLGKLWTDLPYLDFNEFWRACRGIDYPTPQFLANLPSYSWDHDQTFWKESRLSKQFRFRTSKPHPLLGVQTTCIDDQFQWRNILKLENLSWLRGHVVQDDVVLPAAAYVSMALDASEVLYGDRSVHLVELQDLCFEHPVTVDDNTQGVEICFWLRKLSSQHSSQDGEYIYAEFSCAAGRPDSSQTPRRNFYGKLRIQLGDISLSALPELTPCGSDLQQVHVDEFYNDLASVGLPYSGTFKGLVEAQRKLNYAESGVRKAPSIFKVHPVYLDLCFQAIFVAYAAPGDRSMWSPFLPQHIQTVSVNPLAWQESRLGRNDIHVTSNITGTTPARETQSATITGDSSAFNQDGRYTEVQIEGLRCAALMPSGPSDDTILYSQIVWRPSIATGLVLPANASLQPEEPGLTELCERLSLYYYKRLQLAILEDCIPRTHRPLFNYIAHLLPLVLSGKHPTAKADWLNDSWEDLEKLTQRYLASVDVQLIQAVGENIVQVVKGTTTMLEHMLVDQMLTRLYIQGIGFENANKCLSHGVAQLAHQHPNMRILEIGAGTGGTSSSVLEALGDAYSSYHFTDVSMGFISSAEAKFGTKARAMDFGVLDIEQDIIAQGYAEEGYDLIIASNVLHATGNLRHTLRTVRRLLRSGGYLVLLETTGDLLRCGFIMCGLPGWWLGQNDGRAFSPTQSCGQWDAHLKASGFSGADLVTHDNVDEQMHTFSVIFAQATDATIDSIRAPMASVYTCDEVMLVIGNAGGNLKSLLPDTKSFLESHSRSVITLNSLNNITAKHLEPTPHVLYLGELDAPIFADMSPESLAAIQNLVQHSKSILWVTTGRHVENPYSNMMVGLLRCIQNESTNIQMQVVDFASKDEITSHVLGEAFLRFINMAAAANSDRLLTLEPELAIVGNKILIPRVLPISDMNAQWNSFRRVIRQDSVRSRQSSLDNSSSFSSKHETLEVPKIKICVEASTTLAVRVGSSCFLFLVLGHVVADGQRVLSLVPATEGVLEVPSNCVYPLAYDCITDERLLFQSLCYIVAESVLERCIGKTILLHNCDWRLIKGIQAATSHIRPSSSILTSAFNTSHSPNPPDIIIHPRATKAQIIVAFPGDLDFLVDFTTPNAAETTSSENVIQSLQDRCTVIRSNEFVSSESIVPASWDAHRIANLLRTMAELGRGSNDHRWIQGEMGAGSGLTRKSPPIPHDTLIHRLDTTRLFRSERTYLLCGLTGEIGQSICTWMVQNGARYVVLASRSPNFDRSWCLPLEHLRAKIVVLSLDVCNEEALNELIEKLRATMPPIAGVAHGAMVLSDATFANMTMKELQRVLHPKVVGSINLDKAFKHDKLDFFIMFSSLSCVIGNIGQSNYAAANMFMQPIANQRRERGLSASVIDLGMIVGVGYMNRAGPERVEIMARDFMRVSESALHDIFAQAIIAGAPESGYPAELITGLAPASSTDTPMWYSNPIFSHHRNKTSVSKALNMDKAAVSIASIKQQIEAKSTQDALEILRSNLSTQLADILQLKAAAIQFDKPLIQHGVDSLMAVEISSRIYKHFEYKVSVLKILSGLSADEIALQALASVKSPETTIQVVPANKKDFGQSPIGKIGASNELPAVEGSSTSVEIGLNQLTSANESQTQFSYNDSGYNSEGERSRSRASKRQRSLWYTAASFDTPTMYNCTWVYAINGRIDSKRLETAIRSGCHRHETMRTAFNVDDDTGELVQDIRPTPNHEWVCTAIEDDSALENAIATVEHQVYDLQGGRTSSFMLCTLSEQVHYLVVGYHHIILDGTAWQIVLRDVLSMYSSGEVLPLARMQYRHYALDGEEDSEDHRAFWKAQFATVPSTLPLFPFAKTAYRFPIQTPSIHTFEEAAPVHITEQVMMACRKLGITTMHFHVSVLQIMVSLLAGTRELCIGMGDANRNDERYGDVAGLLASVHPLRLVLEDGVSFAQVAGQARDAVLAAMDHAQVSFETIIDDIGVERNSSFTPLFQVMINYVSGFSDRINLEGATIKHHYAAEATHAQDLILTIRDTREEMRLYFTVQESLYTRGHAQMMAKIYIDLLDHCSINVDEQVNTLDLLRPEWREQGLRLGQGLTIPLPNLESLDRLIADKAGQYPNNVAAKDDTGRTISYSGLMDRVGDIAATLATCGTSSGVPVCIIGDHTIDVLCAVIAVWKLGAVYVPIDADNPHERIKTMLKNCKATVAFVSGEKAMSTARETKISVIITADLRVHSLTDEFPVAIMPPDTAAIFHTSGTTGEPKGVILTHDNLLTQVAAVQQRYPSLQPRVLQQSGHSFDASLFQILVSLCTGGTLVMTAHRREPETITKIICDESITTTLAVPSEYLMWFQYGKELSKASHWHTAFCGGDAMTNNVIRGFAALELRNLQLINAYGPTEASITCSMGTVNYCTKDSELLSTGSALPNYTLSVVDEQGRPLPPGWTGEVCIQGRALSPGYVDASLQVYSFESHKSFVKELHESYLTGDVGRMTGDGNLLLMGRIVSDSYQKIHGNRIEPLEISKVILQASDGAIAECAAIIKSDETPFIVAYVTFARDHNIEAQEEYLRRLKGSLPLPSYMLPATILPVAELPKTSSGKVDNKALRSLSLSRQRLTEMSQDCITADEEIVAAIWNEVIPTPLHSLYKSSSADFFSVGGNSILLLKVISKLRNLSNPDLTLRTVLENPTLSGMAALIRSPGFLEQDRNVRIDELDWGWETSLSNSIPINIVRSPSSTKSNTGHVVLLTGATGFIGRHILSILCSHDQVAAVHCVAVRSPDSLQDIVTTYPNVHLHAGDLASPLLGLSQKDFSSLAASITMIVHNGATVSFLQPYASLRAANVTSTKELIRLATPRRIPFHYISTAGVAELTDLSSLREKSVARYIPPAGASGYTTSKWASEVVLENASASYEIPVTVHRPSSVVEAAEKPDEVLPHDALGTLLRFSRKLRAVPLLKKWTGCFDMVPVDQVAQHIVEEALLPSTGGIRYKHIAGSKTVSAQGLDKFVATQMQDLVEVVPMEDWIDRAKTHGLREDLSEWFLAVASKPRFLPPIVMGSDL